jgi:hypothetical protein
LTRPVCFHSARVETADFQQLTLKVLRWEEKNKRFIIKDAELVVCTWFGGGGGSRAEPGPDLSSKKWSGLWAFFGF